jgi:acetyltransferase-like isoleucine patch superfamily enzyme
MNLHRIEQVLQYGWKDAAIISQEEGVRKGRWSIFCDMLLCYFRYNVWTNQYKKEKLYNLTGEARKSICLKYQGKNSKRDKWVAEYFKNRRFLNKWSSYKYETTQRLQERKLNAYRKRYDIGDYCHIEHDVLFERHHYLPGTIKIGNHVNLAKHVYIDYSGEVVIEDNVKLASGITIESHHRDLEAYVLGKDVNIPTQLRICENAYIGTGAIILDSCNYIGKNARIGAGAVVTKDIPDNAVAVGVPAKVIKILGEDTPKA